MLFFCCPEVLISTSATTICLTTRSQDINLDGNLVQLRQMFEVGPSATRYEYLQYVLLVGAVQIGKLQSNLVNRSKLEVIPP